jgi:MbtH protein
MADDVEDTTVYVVVVNHEEQYSIWPDYKAIPNGCARWDARARKKSAWPISKRSGPICGR